MIRVHTLTEETGDDATTGLDLLNMVEGPLVCVTADAAYDTVAVYETAGARGATVVVPPAKTANISGHGPRSPARDRTITLVKQIGRHRWKKVSGYHRQGRVENAFFRYKSIIGDGLRARSPAGQGSEAVLGCEILNRMTALGRPGRCCMNTLWGWGRASWAGCGPDVRRGGQTLIMGYSADKSPLIGHLAGPLRRLEPLVAQRQEKCGPNRPTPTGYSCNNATVSRHLDRRQKIARYGLLRGSFSRGHGVLFILPLPPCRRCRRTPRQEKRSTGGPVPLPDPEGDAARRFACHRDVEDTRARLAQGGQPAGGVSAPPAP